MAQKKFWWLKGISIFFEVHEICTYTRNNVCKGNIEGRESGVDKVCIESQKTSDNASGKPRRDFSLQNKTFSALN